MTRSKSGSTVAANLVIEHVVIDDLRPDPGNPRVHPGDEMDALTRSVAEFGFVEPVVARREDGLVIGGHMRLLAARRLGHRTVPVVYVDLPIEKARLLNVALNRISGDWDRELLARLLADLDATPNVDISLTGFGDDEIAKLLKSLDARERRSREETFDLDAAWQAAKADTRVQRGDIFRLGDHRVMCGDSTSEADVGRLMGTQRAMMAFCDPPYNVDFGNHGGAGRKGRRRTIVNDALPPKEWEAFVRDWATHLMSSVDGAIYICMSSKEWPTVSKVLEEQGGHWSDTIIWAKDRFVLGRADYQREYEPIWYGWREGSVHYWCGDRDQGDVWKIDRPSESELHPTQKTLELVERAIENSSQPNDVVIDAFLGSRTTLIAAERTGRRCYGMELDASYVSLVLARWEAFTGLTAEKVSD
jgi:DNA modification methylase